MPKDFRSRMRSVKCPELTDCTKEQARSYIEGFDYMVRSALSIWDIYKAPTLLIDNIEEMNITNEASSNTSKLEHILYVSGIHTACDRLRTIVMEVHGNEIEWQRDINIQSDFEEV